MCDLIIEKSNEVFLKIKTQPHIEYELRDRFTFQVESAKFMPQYRNRNWNGEIHLYDMRSKQSLPKVEVPSGSSSSKPKT